MCVFSDVYVSNLSQALSFNSTSTPILPMSVPTSVNHQLVIIINQLSIPPI